MKSFNGDKFGRKKPPRTASDQTGNGRRYTDSVTAQSGKVSRLAGHPPKSNSYDRSKDRRFSDTASEQINSVSRHAYHEIPTKGLLQRQRSKSADGIKNDADSTGAKDDTLPKDHAWKKPPQRKPSLDPRDLGKAGNEMDDSAASTLFNDSDALQLQESTTFPEIYTESQANMLNFAMEHRIFLKAALELVAQRDKVATEVGMNDPNILKSGPLKKASHLMRGIWKVKYVEIRRGMFSYYEDTASSNRQAPEEGNNAESLLRKNIPLEANNCQCRAVRLHQKAWTITPRGAIFELAIAGKPKRLWMANSREERQAWIQAIHDAMVGGSVTRGGNPASKSNHGKSGGVSSRSPYKDDLKKYVKMQGTLRNSKSKEDYVHALRAIYRHEMNVPVKWIIKQAEQDGKISAGEYEGAFHEDDVQISVDQLFKDLLRDTVKVDDEVYHGSSGHAPERITGALARRIMLCGRSGGNPGSMDDMNETTSRASNKYDMTESQALAYARDILLSGNRTRSGGDSYFCVDTLCKNPGLVVVVPSSAEAEPLCVTVARDEDEESSVGYYDLHSRSGWLRTRRKSRNPWVKSYFVLSEGTLSYYEQALPRPHGLQGQLVVSDATITVAREDTKRDDKNGKQLSSYFVLTIVTKDKSERQILFETEERLLVWTYALECTAKAKGGTTPAPLMKAMKGILRMGGVPVGSRASATGDNLGSPKGECAVSQAEASLKEHVANLGLDCDALEERLAVYASQSSATVKVTIQAGTVYKICTLDPQGDEIEDTWATVDATFLQDFRVTGGSNARIIRGEEIVRVDVSQCNALLPSSKLSVPSPREVPGPPPLSTPSRSLDDVSVPFSSTSARRRS